MTDLGHQLGVSGRGAKRDIAKFESQGKFTVSFSKTNNRGIGISQDKIIWHNKKKENMKF